MADFVAVLRKTIDALGENTPEMRERVFEKARTAIEKKLAAIDPPPPQIVAERQRKALEDAILAVRAEYAGQADDSFDDLEAALTDLGDQAPDQDGTAAAPPEPEPQAFQAESGEPLAGPETVAPAAIPASGTSDLEPPADAAVEERAEGIVPGSPDEGEPVDPAAAAVVTGHSATEPPESSQGPVPAPAGRVKPARRTTGLVAAVVALIVIGGAGYAVWLNLDDFAELVGASGPVASQEEVPVAEPAEVAADDAAAPPAEPVAGETDATTAPDAPQKFTQRLLPEGGEVDEGPAGEAPRIGEGTSVATTSGPAIEDPEAEVSPDEAAPDQPVAVGQRAIFYEQSTGSEEGSAEQGRTVWRVVQESPGGDAPPEPAIRAEVTIPAHNLQLRMTIRRNADQTLPASHIAEMIFLTPENFAGGAIDSVLRITLKETEEDTGSPLQGIPAKIADGFFLVALSDSSAEVEYNLSLMRDKNWIDIPVVYRSGRRALMTMEKGIPGERAFQEVLQAWQETTDG
jgi:hypothetical protein